MWSDAQADLYTSELGQFVIESVERPERWKTLTARHDDVYFIHFRRHVIVFREVGAEILVIAVFQDRMNILARIDDLL
ncbi:type II toxin-antitoxin system RelE/ParE family toxin [Lacunimicrobium album]